MRNPINVKFLDHRKSAKRRGIPFLLTFNEWWQIWQQSGKWEQRGRLAHQYVMARLGDKGAYETGNIQIVTVSQNCSEKKRTLEGYIKWRKSIVGNQWSVGRKVPDETRAKISAALKGRPSYVRTPEHRIIQSKAQRRRYTIVSGLQP